MQQDEYTTEQILNKYRYLYKNKELILAQAICVTPSENYYLSKDISLNMINCLRDFLLTDLDITDTELYNYIEFIRNNSFFSPVSKKRIENLNSQRKLNIYLRGVPTFTVWKILDYVRKYYYNNEGIISILDIYYNLDRYMITGIDWNSGYFINEFDIENNNDKLYLFPSTYIVVKGDSTKNGNFTIFNYPGNEYEDEDIYLDFNLEKVNTLNKNLIDIEEKKNLFNELKGNNLKKYFK